MRQMSSKYFLTVVGDIQAPCQEAWHFNLITVKTFQFTWNETFSHATLASTILYKTN